jgi:hypothetical protein
MREFINIIMESRGGFIIDPLLPQDDYFITDSIGDIKNWKARNHEDHMGQNAAVDGERLGEMGPVGYVAISLTDNQIIPISRNDEHHTGYDLLWDLEKRYKIDVNKYYTIWWDTNYISDKREISKLIMALKKYISYGGNGKSDIKGFNEYRHVRMSWQEFIAREGKVEKKPGVSEFAPYGKQFIDLFQNLADAIRAADGKDDKKLINIAFLAAAKTLKFIVMQNKYELSYLTTLKHEEIDAVLGRYGKNLQTLRRDGNLQQMEEMFFDFGGLKNIFHNKISEILNNPSNGYIFGKDHLEMFWGDLELARGRLGDF